MIQQLLINAMLQGGSAVAGGLMDILNPLELLKKGFLAVTQVTMNFDKQMSRVSAVTGTTGKEFTTLRDLAQKMGSTTTKTATEAAQAIEYMGLAGWNMSQIQQGIEPILRASEAGMMDLGLTSDLVTDSMAALGIGTNELNRYLDIGAKAQNTSNQSMQQYLEAMKQAGGSFKMFNVPLEESGALLGILANRGYKGATAGNALISIMSNLTKGTGEAGDAMGALGIEVYDSEGNFRGITTILKELNTKFADMTEEQRNTYIQMIGGKTRTKELNALLNGTSNELDDLTKGLNDSDGALNDMAATMQDNLSGQLTIIKSVLEGIAIKIGDHFTPILRDLASALQVVGSYINDNFDNILKALGELIKGIVSGEFKDFRETMEKLVPPEFMNIVDDVISKLEEFKPIVDLIKDSIDTIDFNVIKESFDIFIKSVKGGTEFFKIILGIILGFVNGTIRAFDNLVAAVMDVSSIVENLKGILAGIIRGDTDLIKEHFGLLIESIKSLYDNLWQSIVDMFVGFGETLYTLLNLETVKNNLITWLEETKASLILWFSSLPEQIRLKLEEWWLAIDEWFSTLPERIKLKLEEWGLAIIEWFNTTKESIITKLEEWWLAISEWFSTIPERIKAKLEEWGLAIIEWTKTQNEENKRQFGLWWNTIKQWYNDTKEKIKDKLRKWRDTITKWYDDTKEKIKDKLSKWWDKITKWYTEAPGKIKDFLSNWWDTMKKWWENTKNRIKEKLEGWWNTIKSWFTNLKNKKEIKNAGKEMIDKMAQGNKEKKQEFIDKLGKIIIDVLKMMLIILVVVAIAVGREIIKRIIEGVVKAKTSLSNTMKKVGSSIINAIKDIPSKAYKWGSNIINELVKGLKSKLGKVTDIANKIASTISNFIGFRSPTKKGTGRYSDKWMPNLINMMVDGVEKYKGKLSNSLSGLAANIQYGTMNSIGSNVSNGISSMSSNGSNPYINITIQADSLTNGKQVGQVLVQELNRLGFKTHK